MDKEKQESLELAISAYCLESASDVLEMIENQKAEDIKNCVDKDYFTPLPTKLIKDNTFIQIIGTEIPDVFMIWRLEKDSVQKVGKLYNSQEVDKFIRKMKIKRLL